MEPAKGVLRPRVAARVLAALPSSVLLAVAAGAYRGRGAVGRLAGLVRLFLALARGNSTTCA